MSISGQYNASKLLLAAGFNCPTCADQGDIMNNESEIDIQDGEVTPPYENLIEDEKKIVDDTICEIKRIVQDATVSTMEKVGNIIISNIFDNVPEAACEINHRGSNSPKAKLFRSFTERVGKDKGEVLLPQKTWLYNAVNLALDKKLLDGKPGYEKYKKLSRSKKIELIPLEKAEQKLEWADKIATKKLSVRQLREALGKPVANNHYGLISYANDPTKIVDVGAIKPVGGKKRQKFLELAQKRIPEIEAEIKTLQEGLDKLKKLKVKINDYTPQKGRPGK